MNFEKAIAIIDHLFKISKERKEDDYKIKKISFAGGEPTLIPWVFDAIKYAKKLGFKVELITNGTNKLDDNQIRYLDVIALDIDAINPQKNKELGKDLEHVKRAEEIIEKAKKHGVYIKINSVLTKKNLYDIFEVAKWIKEKGDVIYRWKIFQFLPSYGLAKKNENILKISKRTFHKITNKIREYMKDWNGQLFTEDNEYMSSAYFSIDQLGNLYVSDEKDGKFETITIGKVEDFNIEKFINHPHISKELIEKRIEMNKKIFK